MRLLDRQLLVSNFKVSLRHLDGYATSTKKILNKRPSEHQNTSNLRHSRGGGSFERKDIEPIEMKRLWFDVTHPFEELLNAFD